MKSGLKFRSLHFTALEFIKKFWCHHIVSAEIGLALFHELWSDGDAKFIVNEKSSQNAITTIHRSIEITLVFHSEYNYQGVLRRTMSRTAVLAHVYYKLIWCDYSINWRFFKLKEGSQLVITPHLHIIDKRKLRISASFPLWKLDRKIAVIDTCISGGSTKSEIETKLVEGSILSVVPDL